MYLVLDIGGTFVKFALMDQCANIIEKGKIATVKTGLEDFLESLVTLYHKFPKVKGIALSCPGQVDVNEGIIYNGGNLQFLHLCNITKELSKRCNDIKVAVENDGKCAGLAESMIGAAKDKQDAIIIAFGTGVGGAIIKDKKVHRGTRLIAGELSFLTTKYTRDEIKRNQWGATGNAIHLATDLDKIKNKPKGTYAGEDVFELALQGDKDANDILEDFYYDIANQIYNMQYIFDPDIFCIGGGISEQSALLEGINKYINLIYEHTFQLTKPLVVKCQFRNDSNLIGALFNFQQIFN